MSVDPTVSQALISAFLTDNWIIFKFSLVVLFFFYFIFTLIIVRQVQLMTDTLITHVSPLLRALSVAYAIIGLVVLIGMTILLFMA